MKKIILCCLCTLLLTACGDSHRRAIRQSVERQMEAFPASTLQDLYKSFFQDNFGPGHIVADTAAARAYLQNELDHATQYNAYYSEPAGRGENFYRVSLAVIADSIVPFDTYFDAFCESVTQVEPVDVEQWKGQWAEILSVIDEMKLNLPDYATHKAEIDSLLDAGKYAYHHSEKYNRLYHPHYRLIKTDIFQQRIAPLIDATRVN